MIVLLRGRVARALYHAISKISWGEVVFFILLHFLTSWAMIAWFDVGREYTQADTYWWFYIVTITTVGYGDFSPETLGARIVAAGYVMPIGIAVMGAVIGKIAAVVSDISANISRGLMQLHLTNHTVVVGDSTQRTVDLLKNLLADSSVGDVALVSTRAENPLPGEISGFVSGEIDDPDVQERVCLSKAQRVIVLADTDVAVTGRTVACMDATESARIVAYYQYQSAADKMNRQSPERVSTVTSLDMAAVVQESLDPGAAAFTHQLLYNSDKETYLRLSVPEGVVASYADVAALLVQHRINPLGLYMDRVPVMCPDPEAEVRGGMTLAVAAADRSVLSGIDWSLT